MVRQRIILGLKSNVDHGLSISVEKTERCRGVFLLFVSKGMARFAML